MPFLLMTSNSDILATCFSCFIQKLHAGTSIAIKMRATPNFKQQYLKLQESNSKDTYIFEPRKMSSFNRVHIVSGVELPFNLLVYVLIFISNFLK